MEMIEAILIIILLSIWLVFSVVFLITAIQNFIVKDNSFYPNESVLLRFYAGNE